MFFQLFLGGRTLKTIPSEKGSKLSTNSSSASPPRVIIWDGGGMRGMRGWRGDEGDAGMEGG